MWNPWHGCHKISAGCRHCYVYREDAAFGTTTATSQVRRTRSFHMPLQLNRRKDWKYPPGSEFALCFTSDFLIEEADPWRSEIWDIIRLRSDCRFFFFTKRIDRLARCLPPDWGDGYDHIGIGCSVENQAMADYRLPIFLDLPIKHRTIVAAPLLGPIDLRPYLDPAKYATYPSEANQANTPARSTTNGCSTSAASVRPPASPSHSTRQAPTCSKTAASTASPASTSTPKPKKPASTSPRP